MLAALLGRKIGMTQVYDDTGKVNPVTVIELGPCVVLQVKTVGTDGYPAVQLGFADRDRKHANRPSVGHARQANTEVKRFIREVRLPVDSQMKAGDVVTVKEFVGVRMVDVVGTSKGKGFQGVVRRHGFRGAPMTHGASKVHRRPGSVGASAYPSRTIKGTRAAGHMGMARRTQKNLKVVKIDEERNLLLVRGAVPGFNGGFVYVRVARDGGPESGGEKS